GFRKALEQRAHGGGTAATSCTSDNVQIGQFFSSYPQAGTLALAQSRVFVVAGTDGALVFTHPVGLVSAGIFFGLLAAWLYARARLAEPVEERP
ncbi:MAG: hypothetical protein ACO3JL_15190, partial [Myxococcota bacterium]